MCMLKKGIPTGMNIFLTDIIIKKTRPHFSWRNHFAKNLFQKCDVDHRNLLLVCVLSDSNNER